MRTLPAAACCLALFAASASAQETNLNRSEVTAIKNKLVIVQQAMGADPAGYLKESEDFSLPTDFNPAQDGRFWPITSSVSMRYTEFQTKYAAAMASGNAEAITQMVTEMTQLQTQAAAAAMSPATRKEPMQVYVQLNMNPTVSIDPDAVVLEQPGVIALREKELNSEQGQVTVYLDPVALQATEELSQFELRTSNEGVTSKSGVYHIVIQANGSVADIETWVMTFDFDAMLGIFDPR
jgi:hypothetical protein